MDNNTSAKTKFQNRKEKKKTKALRLGQKYNYNICYLEKRSLKVKV